MDVSGDAWIALAGTVLGGAGLEVIRRALSKTKDREEWATNLRNELRTDLTAIRAEVTLLEKEVEVWRTKYYELWERHIMAEVELRTLRGEVPPPPSPLPPLPPLPG